jgi:Flp pilus assembly protein TadB
MSDNMADSNTATKKNTDADEKPVKRRSAKEKHVWTSNKETEDKEKYKAVVAKKPNHVWVFGTLTLAVVTLILVTIALWYELKLSLPIATIVGVIIFAFFVYYEYHRSEQKNK